MEDETMTSPPPSAKNDIGSSNLESETSVNTTPLTDDVPNQSLANSPLESASSSSVLSQQPGLSPSCHSSPSFGGGGLDVLLANTEDASRRGSAGRGAIRSNLLAKGTDDAPKVSSLGLKKLTHRWVFGTVSKSNQDWIPETFGSVIKTVDGFWQHLAAMKYPSAMGDNNIFFFKEGVTPQWEHALFANREGSGRIIFTVQDKYSADRLSDSFWYFILLSIVGCTGFAVGYDEIIQGASCTVRQGRSANSMTGRVEVWIAAVKSTDVENIRNCIESEFWNTLPMIEQALSDGGSTAGGNYNPSSLKIDIKYFANKK